MRLIITLSLIFLLFQNSFSQKDTTLALTPPMGWNSWNTFATDINEELIKGIADSIVSKGLFKAGYTYIVLDDGWMAMERDKNNNLIADSIKFPNGMKHLADYVHSKGLKFGLYNCAGNKTCAGYPGSRGHEYQDAQLYASWDVDFLKYDWCNTGDINAKEAYITMRNAMYATKRPMVFSICEWGDNNPWEWGKDVGHAWRTSGDITPCFDCEENHGTWSSWGFMKIIFMRDSIRSYAGPGHWNDYDMMEVGNGMTQAEDRTHFALWCMVNSPLILGNDVRIASKETIEILTNPTAISINQDSLGIPAFLYSSDINIDVWIKPLSHNNWAICIVNKNDKTIEYTIDLKDKKIIDPDYNYVLELAKLNFTATNVYSQTKISKQELSNSFNIEAHDVLFILIQQ